MDRSLRSKITIVAVVAMAAVGATACGSGSTGSSSSSAAKPQALTVWHYWDGKNADTFTAMVAQYEKANAGTTVKVVNVPGADMQTKLRTALSSHTTPDISIGDLVNVPQLAQSGRLVDLKPLIPASTWSDLYPSMLSFGAQAGRQVSIPVSANDLALIYNKSLMQQAGITTVPTTWEQMQADSAKIRAKTGKPGFELYTQAGDTGEGLTWNFQISLWQAGGAFLNKDNTKAAFNTDAGRHALHYWVDLIRAKASPLAPWGAFEKGNAASAQEGSWMVGIWAANAPFGFGTAQIPAPQGGQQATNLGGEQAVVFASNDARQRAAGKFLTWFTDPAQNLPWSEQTGFLPVRTSVAKGADYASYIQTKSPQSKPFVDALPTAHARPNTPKYAEASLAFAKQIERALYGTTSVDAALSAAERDVNAVLSSNP